MIVQVHDKRVSLGEPGCHSHTGLAGLCSQGYSGCGSAVRWFILHAEGDSMWDQLACQRYVDQDEEVYGQQLHADHSVGE